MIDERKNNERAILHKESNPQLVKRPLIGVPTGRESSQRLFGLALYIMNQTYVRVLESLGALPVLIPLGMSEETLCGTLERLDGLFLAGGEDMDPSSYAADRRPHLGTTDAERDRTELLLTEWAIEAGMPLLGVCRGIQVINVACGGTLNQDLNSERPELAKHDYFPPAYERMRISHKVTIDSNSRLAHALGATYQVNSMHHQGIERLGTGLRAVAMTDDGLVEGVEIPELPFAMGVQWHPEELVQTDSQSWNLFHDFVVAAAADWRSVVAETNPTVQLMNLPQRRASFLVSKANATDEGQPVACS